MGRATELEPGEVFAGRYELQRLLGEGDRKRTYLARDKKMDRLVAISFVKPEAVLEDPEGTEREAKVLGRIGRHDNIVSLYDYDLDADGSVEYMVFEYLSGGTLAEYLRKAGKRSLEEVLRLGRQLCRGLAHLHRRGLMLALDGDLAKAEPKTLRYRVLHAAARLVRGGRRRCLTIQATWPWAGAITTAWQRITALPQAP